MAVFYPAKYGNFVANQGEDAQEIATYYDTKLNCEVKICIDNVPIKTEDFTLYKIYRKFPDDFYIEIGGINTWYDGREIGYVLQGEYQNHGIMKIVVPWFAKNICKHKNLFVRCRVDNEASNNFSKRMGFVYNKTVNEPSHNEPDGPNYDYNYYNVPVYK